MKPKQLIPRLLVLVGLAGYLVPFFATRLPSLESRFGHVWRRIDFLQFLLIPEVVLEGWFGSPPKFALLDRLPVLAIAGAILACSLGLGWLVLAACRVPRRLGRLESLVFSTAAGANVLSTYVLLVGLCGWLGSRLVLVPPAVLALGAAVCWWLRRARESAEAVAQEWPGRAKTARSPQPGPARLEKGLSRHWLWLAAPFVLVILLGGMLPPVEFDVREYHLQAPKEFFQQGRIGFLPHNVYANMPLGSEMLCLLAMVLAGDWWLGALAGKTVIAAFTPLTALGLFAAGRRFFSPTAGVVAAVVYVSIPWIVQVSTYGQVEGASACYLLLAVYAMWLWQEEKGLVASPGTSAGAEQGPQPSGTSAGQDQSPAGKGTFLGLSGYLAGGAVACKYPAVLFVVIPLTVWCFLAAFRSRWSAAWRPAAVFLLAVLLGCGLWFGKNWALTGNPTYPLLYSAFDGKGRTLEKDAQWNRVHRPKDFTLATLGRDLARVALTSEWLSPLAAPLAVLALFAGRKRRLTLILWAYLAYVVAAWWLWTHRIDRFWIPALPLLSLLAGAGTCWSIGHLSLRRGFLMAVLVAGLAWSFLVDTSGPGGYNRYFVPLHVLRTAPERLDAWHRYWNTHAAEGVVLLVGEARVFDLEVPVLYNTCFDGSIFEELVKGRTADQIRDAFAGRQIAYVYVHWGEIARYRRTGYGFSDFVQPDVFAKLEEQGILDPLPPIKDHDGRGYRVVAPGQGRVRPRG
jgi:hypothetical protein